MNVLDFKNVDFSYSEREILKNLSFTLKKNEFLSIVGSSGCGKSTIIKIIAGIENCKNGKIKSLSTGYMPQKDLLLPWRTIIDNITLPFELSKKDKKISREIALKYLKKLNLEDYKDKLPNELSGGMKQRISFLRTLLTEADILLLDEPFSAVDAITKEYLQKWLLETLKQFNKSIIFITHDINEALFLSDRILVCKNRPLDSFEEFIVPIDKKIENLSQIKNDILNVIRGENI